MSSQLQDPRRSLRVVSLFSGIGGFELGFKEAGMEPVLFCESDPSARKVLSAAWPGVEISEDIRSLEALPDCEVITAGFPCQDLSQAGRKAGIAGDQSGLVEHLFRLLRGVRSSLKWVVVENVPYMLGLDRGHAMETLIERFEKLGYSWAYRVVDSRSFGIPQRRPRVLFVASPNGFPHAVLLGESARPIIDEKPAIIDLDAVYGFYWTEGWRGLGWVRNGVPPIKGGSGLGIPSPPALWVAATGELGKPSIHDAERLQGFPGGWTEPAMSLHRSRVGVRWRLIGNAVNVATAKWLGNRLACIAPRPLDIEHLEEFRAVPRWPGAAVGGNGVRLRLPLSPFPETMPMQHIGTFLEEPLTPLSQKAALGFLNRALSTPKLVYSPMFLNSLRAYCGLLESYVYTGKLKAAS